MKVDLKAQKEFMDLYRLSIQLHKTLKTVICNHNTANSNLSQQQQAEFQHQCHQFIKEIKGKIPTMDKNMSFQSWRYSLNARLGWIGDFVHQLSGVTPSRLGVFHSSNNGENKRKAGVPISANAKVARLEF